MSKKELTNATTSGGNNAWCQLTLLLSSHDPSGSNSEARNVMLYGGKKETWLTALLLVIKVKPVPILSKQVKKSIRKYSDVFQGPRLKRKRLNIKENCI